MCGVSWYYTRLITWNNPALKFLDQYVIRHLGGDSEVMGWMVRMLSKSAKIIDFLSEPNFRSGTVDWDRGRGISAMAGPKRILSPGPTSTELPFELNPTSRDHEKTITLDCDVIDDKIEEFSRLKRLGNFRQAHACFRNHLKQREKEPLVFVEYAEMLLEQGNYSSVNELDSHAHDVFTSPAEENLVTPSVNRLKLNWELIKTISMIRTKEMWGILDRFNTNADYTGHACTDIGSSSTEVSP